MISGMLEMGCEYYFKIHVQGMCHCHENQSFQLFARLYMLQLFVLSMVPQLLKKKI